jgi:hypothetical protein
MSYLRTIISKQIKYKMVWSLNIKPSVVTAPSTWTLWIHWHKLLSLYFFHRLLLKTRRFGGRLCFSLQAKKHISWWTPYIAILRHWVTGKSYIRGSPGKVLLCLKAEAEPTYETSCFLKLCDGQSPEKEDCFSELYTIVKALQRWSLNCLSIAFLYFRKKA